MRKYLWVIKAIAKLKMSTQKDVITHFLTAKKKYLPKEKTHANVDDIVKCALCPNMCRFDCPVLQAAKSETFSPAGKARLAYLMEMGRIQNEDVCKVMYACAGCDACKMWCPFDFSVETLLKGVREDMVAKRLVPPRVMDLKRQVVKEKTVYESGITSLELEKKGECLYFAGCTVLNKTREIADATITVMEKAGIDVGVLPEEWCCGAPLSISGFNADFKKVAADTTRIIKEGGYKTVVCSCPVCAYMFKQVYPEIGFSLDVTVLHSTQALLPLVDKGEIQLKECKKVYTYHDPCVLARKLEVYTEPRALLHCIPGLILKEAEFNAKQTKCCGRGGLLTVTNPEISLAIAKERSSSLKEVSSSVVTACPACKMAFRRNNLDAVDVAELVLECLK